MDEPTNHLSVREREHVNDLALQLRDQGLLVTRKCYLAAGGFAPIPLFEDVDLVARLRREQKGCRLAGSVITSGRRYRKNGHWLTTLRMWGLRIRYRFGARPDELQRQYDKN